MAASPNSAQDLEIQVDANEETSDTDLQNDEEDKQLDNSSKDDHEGGRSLGGNEGSKADKNGTSSITSSRVCTSSNEVKDIRSRVFVGHLNTDRATRSDVEKLFEKCGKINAISLLSGYGFVQFDNEESALKAIEKYHGTVFFNTKLVVDKPAACKRLDGEKVDDLKPWPNSRRSRRYSDEDDRRGSYRRRHEDIPPRYRDPSYERYLEMRYMEERLAERYRYSERMYPPPRGRYPDYRDYDYPGPSREYSYTRDDDYDRRPFDHGYR